MKALIFSNHSRFIQAQDKVLMENLPFKTKVELTPKGNTCCMIKLFVNHIPKNPSLN